MNLAVVTNCCCGCFKLVSCDDEEDIIYTRTDLSDYVGLYVTIDGETSRYSVANSSVCDSPQAVTVTGSFSSCESLLTCGNCDTGLACEHYQIVISGVVNGTASDAANVNGTFIVTKQSVVPSFFQSDACFWSVPLGYTLANGADSLCMAIFGPASSLTGTIRIQFYLAATSTLKGPNWSDVQAALRVGCETLTNQSTSPGSSDVPHYNASGSSALVTSLCT